jgi:hypothetical protein
MRIRGELNAKKRRKYTPPSTQKKAEKLAKRKEINSTNHAKRRKNKGVDESISETETWNRLIAETEWEKESRNELFTNEV